MIRRLGRRPGPLVAGVVATAMAAWLTAVPPTSAGFTAVTQVAGNTLRTVTSLWDSTDAPAMDSGDGNAAEMGVKFQPKVDGEVVGVRFYKSAANTGVHTGRLWSLNGIELATTTYTAETPTGWQTALFAAPVAVTAHTIYIASTYMPNGNYNYDDGYFTTTARDRPALLAPAAGDFGCNAVYRYGPAGSFPKHCHRAMNYWVDVMFRPAAGPVPSTDPVRQQHAGVTRIDSTDPVAVTLPRPTTNGSTILLAVTSRNPVTTPTGFTLDHQQTDAASVYLFRRTALAGESSWSIATTVAGPMSWWVAEVTGLAGTAPEVAAGNGQGALVTAWSTPAITPGAGSRLLVAVAGRSTESDYIAEDSGAFTDSFTKRADSVVQVAAGPTVGHSVATRLVAADGVTAYQTSTTYRTSGPIAVIAAYVL